MKITAVTPFVVDPGYGKNWLFVKVETSDGLHGWGECYTQADRDQSIVAHVRQLARYLVGRDAGQIRHFTHWAYHDFASKRGAMDFWSAVSGLDESRSRFSAKPSTRNSVPRSPPAAQVPSSAMGGAESGSRVVSAVRIRPPGVTA